MKRLLALVLVLGVALSAAALAGEGKMAGKKMTGTITRVDNDRKMMTVKDSHGKEWSVYWTDTTKIEGGAPREGATVSFTARSKDGKTWATWLKTGEAHKM